MADDERNIPDRNKSCTNRAMVILISQATGLIVSYHSPWLGASPDDRVLDPDSAIPGGLAEYKNPYIAREMPQLPLPGSMSVIL